VAVGPGEPETAQVGEGRPEAGRPDDRVERLLASVGPAGTPLGEPLDHRLGHQVAAIARGAHRRHGDDVAQRADAAGLAAGGAVADRLRGDLEEHATVDVVGEVARWAAGRPVDRGGGAEQVRGDLGAGVAAAHDQHPLAGERLGPAVVVDVQHLALEPVGVRDRGPQGAVPRAGGRDDRPGAHVAVVGADQQAVVGALDGPHAHRSTHVDVVALLVVGEVVHDVRRVGRLVTRRTRHQSAGQRAVAGGGEEPQARPGVLPRAPGRRAGVEQHHRQRGAGAPALGPAQVEGERQRGLPAADDADVDGLRQGPAQGPGRRPAQQHVLRRSISTVSRHSPSSWAMRERTASVT
jgi:hypothetical protein